MNAEHSELGLVRNVTDPIAERLMKWYNGPYPVNVGEFLSERQESPPLETQIKYYEDGFEKFKIEFAKRSWQYSLLLVLITVTYAVADYCLADFSLQLMGLAVDLFGAVVLGRGLISGPVTVIEQSMSGFGGYNSDLRDSLLSDTIDGTWGISLLLLGILIQATSVAVSGV